MPVEIRHERDAGRFVARLDGAQALLEYRVLPDGTWDMTRTWVPDSHRRRGVASALVRHGLDRARDEGVGVRPSCWFVAEFIAENPDYLEVTARELTARELTAGAE